MELAVNIPEQEPQVGQDLFSSSRKVFASIWPVRKRLTPSEMSE